MDVKIFLPLAVCLLCGWAAPSHAQELVGWRNNGYGHFPQATPVHEWDDSSGKNIAFRTPLPNWSQSSPVVITRDNGRPMVLLTCESLDWQPLLLAIDGDTGKELWRIALDHRPGEASDLKQQWSAILHKQRQLNRLRSKLNDLTLDTQAKPDDATAAKALSDLQAQIAEMKYEAQAPKKKMGRDRGDGYSLTAKGHKFNALRKQGFGQIDNWGMGNIRYKPLTWIGFSFPTPIVDTTAKAIYVYTGYHGVHRLTYDGQIRWTKWLGGIPGQTNHITTNPVIKDKYLIITSSEFEWLNVLDTKTGETIWSHGFVVSVDDSRPPRYSAFGVHTPRIITLDGIDFLYHSSGKLFRLSDGKLMLDKLPKGDRLGGSALIDKDTLWMTWHIARPNKMKECSFRFRLDGDQVIAEELWSQKPPKGRFHITPAVCESLLTHDRIFSRTGVVDRQSGKTLTPLPWPRAPKASKKRQPRFPVGIPFSLVGKRYLIAGGKGGLDMNREGVFWVFDIVDHKLIAENRLEFAPVDQQREAFIRGESASGRWLTFSQSSPFFWQDRIYIRSFDYLYGIWAPQ